MLQTGATDVGVRLPAVPDTPCVSAAARGAFRVSEGSTPYATSGGLQLRGMEHLHDRSVGEGIMLSPQRPVGAPSGASTSGGGDSQGLTALVQTIIAGKPVHLQGARITPSQVEAFVKQKRIQLWSGVFLLSQLDGDIDKNAMSIIELQLANSRALERKPGSWRETWDVEYFLKALEEVFAKEEVDKFSEPAGVWRALMTMQHSRAGSCLCPTQRLWWKPTTSILCISRQWSRRCWRTCRGPSCQRTTRTGTNMRTKPSRRSRRSG